MARFVSVGCLIIGFVFAPALLDGARQDTPQTRPNPTPPAYVTYLAEYTFDDGFGGPDPQGWVSYDLTAQLDTFTHVDDFAGMPPPWTAIEGGQSMWIGSRDVPELCDYKNLPGYGNQWLERLESVSFVTSGDVDFSYQVCSDTEAGYDPIIVAYQSKNGAWRTLAEYDGPGVALGQAHATGSHTVPEDSLDGSVRFRFTFTSDGQGSDQDGLYPNPDTWGAVIIDSITVTDDGGLVDYQDFESEAVGARVTTDGDWFAGSTEYFGDFAGLFDGTTVLQEDTSDVNTTYLWGFFNGSPDTYACGGFPGQASVPLAPVVGYTTPPVYIVNTIESPVINLTRNKDGFPVAGPPDQIAISYDVYVDPVPNNLIKYNLYVRFYENGCFNRTRIWYNPGNSGPNKAWHREQTVATAFGSNVTHIQVGLFAVDYGWYGLHTCNSHAPLFDNVNVDGWFETTTDVRPIEASLYALHPNAPNPFKQETRIPFNLPDGGGEVRLSVYDVTGRWVTTLLDGYRPSGPNNVFWHGRDAHGDAAASGVYFYRLESGGRTLSRKMVLLR